MNVVTVNINGTDYNLKGIEDEEYLYKLSIYVDRKLKSIIENNPKLSLTSAAVLTALNAADEMFKCDEAYDKLKEKVDKLIENEEKNRSEVEALKKQLVLLEKNNELLKQKTIELDKLNNTTAILEEEAKKYKAESIKLKEENKGLRFQIQSYKYKTMDLQNKLIENGINLAKAKQKIKPVVASDL